MCNFTLKLNARLTPIDREDIYEYPLGDILEENDIGRVKGGDSFLAENGEIAYCEIKITLNEQCEKSINHLLQAIDALGVPKGSVLKGVNINEPVGRLEGLALYMNETELPEEVYTSCDINYAIEQICRLLNGIGEFHSYMEKQDETALYFYGSSYHEMKDLIRPFIKSYPLCKKSKLKQIA